MTFEVEEDYLASIETNFSVDRGQLVEFSVKEINLSESLLTPGVMTSVLVDAYAHASGNTIRDYDLFKNADLEIKVTRPILEKYGFTPELRFTNTIYRLQNRKLINNNTETLTLQACHETQLEDARKLMSFSRKCDTPSSVVNDVLRGCLGAKAIDVEDAEAPRPYIAENIHPFQVISQQADVALANGNDPSFIHYMTYENKGTHHFKSLYSLSRQSSIRTFVFNEVGNNLDKESGYRNPTNVMSHSFPCDFDLLSDLLNGINTDGSFIGSLAIDNMKNGLSSLFGGFQPGFCSTAATFKSAHSNVNTAQEQDSCPLDVEIHLLKRQARMSLIERDKIALRLTVPWNPDLNAGKVIAFERHSLDYPNKLLYGSGEYLIHSVNHIIKAGGYSTTAIDCVSTTVGRGIV